MALSVLEQPEVNSFDGNPITLKISTDTVLSTPNLRIQLDIYFPEEPGGAQVVLTSLQLEPDVDGDVTFKIEKYLSNALRAWAVHFPDYEETAPVEATTHISPYELRYFELSGEPPQGGSPTTITGKNVIRGGLSWEAYPGSDFFDTANASIKLTQHPTGKLTDYFAQEFLYVLINNHVGLTGLQIDYQIWYTDGTNESIAASSSFSAANHKIYAIPASWAWVKTHSTEPLKDISSWEITVENTGGGAPTVSHKYDAALRYRQFNRTLLYINSWGGLDSLPIMGGVDELAIYDRATSEHYHPHDYAVEVGQEETFRISEDMEITAFSLPTNNRATQQLIRELMLSHRVLEDKGTRFLPVKMVAKKNKLGAETDDLFNAKLQYRYKFKNEYYTAE